MLETTGTRTHHQSPDPKLVFVVDDDRVQSEEIAGYLRHKGVSVVEFHDAGAAVNEVFRRKPRLVLTCICACGAGFRSEELGN